MSACGGPELRIWGRKAAFNVQKVLWCADELGLSYERVDAGLRYGVVDTPAYAALNPNRRVPTLEDGPLVLWESNAIVRYLCARYGMARLCPEDLQHRADVDRWMDWQAATVYYPAFRAFYLSIVRDPPERQDAERLAALRRDVVASLQVLELHLAKRQYVGGDTLTMGDIPIGTVLDKWMRMPIERPPAPALNDYYLRLKESAAYRACVVDIALDAI
jgi:glutathione S-transferase